MNNKVKESFKKCLNGGWDETSVKCIKEYSFGYVLWPQKEKNDPYTGVNLNYILKDGSILASDIYDELFEEKPIKEYSFNEFKDLCM